MGELDHHGRAVSVHLVREVSEPRDGLVLPQLQVA
jgi:hypothetical protein